MGHFGGYATIARSWCSNRCPRKQGETQDCSVAAYRKCRHLENRDTKEGKCQGCQTKNGKVASSSTQPHNVCRCRKTDNGTSTSGKRKRQRCLVFLSSHQGGILGSGSKQSPRTRCPRQLLFLGFG